jgi:hypothetical protein
MSDTPIFNPLDIGARDTPKPNIGATWPPNAIESEWQRLEPLITPDLLVQRFLFGIPLVSNMPDPVTGKVQVMTPEMLKDYIDGAVQEAENDTHLAIMPTMFQEKNPFDRNHFLQFGFLQLRRKPIQSIDKLAFTPSTEIDVFVLPNTWISTSQLYRGRVQIIPMLPAMAGSASGYTGSVMPPGQGGAGLFLGLLATHPWIPDFIQAHYTTGFPEGLIPRPINDLIGIIAAQEVLSQLAATYARSTGHSLGIDGMSQSVSTPGPALFDNRIAGLEEKRRKIVKKAKTMFGQKFFTGTV